jgi:2Fe-2S ferredoxin
LACRRRRADPAAFRSVPPKTRPNPGSNLRDFFERGIARAGSGLIARCKQISMVKITYIDSGGTTRTVEGEVGSTVMETAIKNSVPEIEAECGGACACSTCHVYVEEGWKEKTGEPSPMEEDMLDFAFDVKPNSRLSCQIKVSDELEGLVVRTPERQA